MAHTFVMQSCLFIMLLRNKDVRVFWKIYQLCECNTCINPCLCDEVNGSKANLATSHPWHLNFIVC